MKYLTEITELEKEVVRLKELQAKLKLDISKFKLVLYENPDGLDEKEKKKLLANFNERLKMNSWILRKVLNKMKQVEF